MTHTTIITSTDSTGRTTTRKVRNPVELHKMWDRFLQMEERWGTRRPVATHTTRENLLKLADTLSDTVREVWENRTENRFVAKITLNRMVRLETELQGFKADTPLREDFSVRKSGWVYDPDANRLQGDTEELEAEAEECRLNARKLRFQLHKVRNSTANRVKMAKLGLIASFSWAEAWGEAKQQMSKIGAEIKSEEQWANTIDRELKLRTRNHDFGPWRTSGNEGAIECDNDYDLPEIQPAWTAKDLYEMSR